MWFSSFRLTAKIHLLGASNDQAFRPLQRATAVRGGSDKPLKRLERNFILTKLSESRRVFIQDKAHRKKQGEGDVCFSKLALASVSLRMLT